MVCGCSTSLPLDCTKLRVDSLKVNVSPEINDTLCLNPATEYLLVGEKSVSMDGVPYRYYSMFVDNEGVLINSPLPNRDRQTYSCAAGANYQYSPSNFTRGENALYVDGNVRITGTLQVDSLLVGSNVVWISSSTTTNSNGMVTAQTLCGIDETMWQNIYFKRPPSNDANIYYNGKITLGNQYASAGNLYTFNVAESANATIHKSQFCIQNTAILTPSLFRLAILGSACNSPAIVNTGPNVPLEFHAGRAQTYFAERYMGSNPLTGLVYPVETPVYSDASNAPHMCIDIYGNVGIKTGLNPPVSYSERNVTWTNFGPVVTRTTVTKPADLHVEGTMFAKKILYFDSDCNIVAPLDDVFARKSQFLNDLRASQIVAGTTQAGVWNLQGAIGVHGAAEPGYDFTVHCPARFKDDTLFDGAVTMSNGLRANSITVDELAVFTSLQVTNNLLVEGKIYVGAPGSSNLFAYGDASNVGGDMDWVRFGQGLSTQGRIGVGVRNTLGPGQQPDSVFHQMTVTKHRRVQWEAEFSDKSIAYGGVRTAYMGHATHLDLGTDGLPTAGASAIGGSLNDGSFIIMTPVDDRAYWKGNYTTHPQNIYLYPGQSVDSTGSWYLRSNNPPTLGAFVGGTVGINTFAPRAHLHVVGNVAWNGDAYHVAANGTTMEKLAMWKEATVGVLGTPTLSWNDPALRNAGMHTAADTRFGLTVAGGLYAPDGYYDEQGRRCKAMIDGSTTSIASYALGYFPEKIFTPAQMGIGAFAETATLTLKNPYQVQGMTKLSIVKSDYDYSSAVEFMGTKTGTPWTLLHCDVRDTLEFGRYTSNHMQYKCQYDRALWMQFNETMGLHQVVIGAHSEILPASLNPHARLTVGGDMQILGDLDVQGEIRVRGCNIVIGSNNAVSAPAMATNDVWLAGDTIYMTPSVGKSIVVGYDVNRTTVGKLPKLHVYQDDTAADTVALFKGANPLGAFLVVANASGSKQLKIGCTQSESFVIQDELNQTYIKFKNDGLTTYTGFGDVTPYAPLATLHVSTTTSGSDLFRMSKLTTADQPNIGAEAEWHKMDLTSGSNWRWVARGPDAAVDQKFALAFQTDVTDLVSTNAQIASSVVRTERMCLTSSGRMGLGVTDPSYTLDVSMPSACNADLVGLRMTHPVAGGPVALAFQSGTSNGWGAGPSQDVAFLSSNGVFTGVQQKDGGTRTTWLQLSERGTLGLAGPAADAASNFTVQVNGTLNATEGVYLNGIPLFTLKDLSNGITLVRENLYWMPAVEAGLQGGVHINWNLQSSNLFYIRGAVSNANLLTMESETEQCMAHWRTHGVRAAGEYDSIFRLAASNDAFTLWHNRAPDSNLYEWIPGVNDAPSYHCVWESTPVDSTWLVAPTTWDYNTRFCGTLGVQSDRDAASLSLGEVTLTSTNCNLAWEFGPMSASATSTTGSLTNPHLALSGDLKAQTVYFRNYFSNLGAFPSAATWPGMVAVADSNARAFFSAQGEWWQFLSKRVNDFTRLGDDGPVLMTDTLYLMSNALPYSNADGLMSVSLGSASAPFTNLYLSNALYLQSFALQANAQAGVSLLGGDALPATLTVGALTLGSNVPGLTLQADYGTCNVLIYYGESNFFVPIRQGDAAAVTSIALTVGNMTVTTTSNATSPVFAVNSADGAAPLMQLIAPGAPEGTGPLTTMYYVSGTGQQALGNNSADHLSNLPGLFNIFSSNQEDVGIYIDWRGKCNIVEIYAESQESLAPALVMDAAGHVALGMPIQEHCNCISVHFGLPLTPFTPTLSVNGPAYFEGNAYFESNVYYCANVEVYGMNTTHGNHVIDSDRRLKSDFERIDHALDRVDKLNGYTYLFRQDARRTTGLVAQEVEEVLPEAVFKSEDGTYSLAYGNLMGLIVESIKELRQEVSELRRKMDLFA